jgi:RNA polymerase sigma-70 factor (ECF subfamily)
MASIATDPPASDAASLRLLLVLPSTRSYLRLYSGVAFRPGPTMPALPSHHGPAERAGLSAPLVRIRNMTRPNPPSLDIPAHLGALRRYALVLTRSADQAEDLVQDALVRAMAAAHTWRPGHDVRKWLLAIVHNTHVSRQRRLRLETATAEQLGLEASEVMPPRQALQLHLSRTVAALMTLPEEQREALVLVAFEGMSYKEAADLLGIPLGTLMSRLGRGREALRAATGHGSEAEGDAAPRRPPLRVVR